MHTSRTLPAPMLPSPNFFYQYSFTKAMKFYNAPIFISNFFSIPVNLNYQQFQSNKTCCLIYKVDREESKVYLPLLCALAITKQKFTFYKKRTFDSCNIFLSNGRVNKART